MSQTIGRPRTQPNTPAINREREKDLARYYNSDPVIGWCKNALQNARRRARRKHLPCDLQLDDIISIANTVSHCPITGEPLIYMRGNKVARKNTASIDRIDNDDPSGYTKQNASIISMRANAIKSNASIDEMIKIGDYARLLASLKK